MLTVNQVITLFKSEKFTQYSMGLFVLFFGSKKQYHNVAHHTIWMAERYKELLKIYLKIKF